MTATLSKKDFKIIGKSIKNPEKIIIELNQKTLDNLVGTRKNKVVLTWLNDKDEGILSSKDEINNFLKGL